MTRAEEARRLERIRQHLGMLAGHEWLLTATGEQMLVEARDRDGCLVTIARLDGKASPDEVELLSGALSHLRFLLSLVDRAIASARQLAGDRPPPDRSGAPAQGQPRSGDAARERNLAAEAAMKCAEPAFKRFLMERHGLEQPATDDRAAQKLRSLLGVTSRRELNSDAAAAECWKKLRGEFAAWRRSS